MQDTVAVSLGSGARDGGGSAESVYSSKLKDEEKSAGTVCTAEANAGVQMINDVSEGGDSACGSSGPNEMDQVTVRDRIRLQVKAAIDR